MITNLLPLLVVLALIVFDLSILRKQDQALFRKIFHFPLWLGILYPMFGVALAVVSHQGEYFNAFFFLFMFPVYLLRRQNFRKTLSQNDQRSESEYVIAMPSHLTLVADAIGLLWLWFFGMAIIIVGLDVVNSCAPQLMSELGQLIVIAAASSLLLIFLIYRTISRYPGLSFNEAIALKREGQSWHKIVTLPAILGLGIAFLSTLLVLAREVQPSTPLGDVLEGNNTSMMLGIFFVMAVLLAPVLEEMIFRGYFFYVLSRYKGQVFAIYFIAIVFALLHVEQYWGDWLAIVMVGFLGLMLSFLRAWTKTSLSTMVAHFFYNGGMTVLPIIMVIVANPTYYQYQTHYQTLDFAGKEKLLQESIIKNPKFPDSYNDLAWLYAEKNVHLDDALALVDKALAMYPKRFAYLDTKAEILYKLGRLEEAVSIAENLVRRYPKQQYVKDQFNKFYEALIKKNGGEVIVP